MWCTAEGVSLLRHPLAREGQEKKKAEHDAVFVAHRVALHCRQAVRLVNITVRDLVGVTGQQDGSRKVLAQYTSRLLQWQ